jgi:trimeric autotransporter adhesin
MKKIYYILTILLCVYVQTANAQMGVNSSGAAPATSAMLDVSSTTKGFLLPRMNTAQRTTLGATAINGMQVFDTDLGEIYLRRFGVWSPMNVPRNAFGISDNSAGAIMAGYNTGTGVGVQGTGSTAAGVVGTSTSGFGVYGVSPSNFGVYGVSTTNVGAYGSSTSGFGTVGLSSSGVGVYGENNSASVAAGKFVNNNANGTSGRFEGTNGIGVVSYMTGSGIGVLSQTNTGNAGEFSSSSGIGLEVSSTSGIALNASNATVSALTPVAQFANLSGGTALNVIATTAINMTGALRVSGGINAQTAFKITSVTGGGGNTVSNQVIIPNTTYANNANDILIVTHNYSPNNTYLNKNFGVYWESVSATWRIYLEEGPFTGVMPNNITFNVLVIKQ